MKLIIEEAESSALEGHLAATPTFVATSRLAVVEVARACKLATPGRQTAEAVDQLLSTCTLVAVSPQLLAAASKLTSPTVRTLDAIHLASALRIDADELLAYDRRLLAAAGEQGLPTAAPSS